jgi:hypothetical protein
MNLSSSANRIDLFQNGCLPCFGWERLCHLLTNVLVQAVNTLLLWFYDITFCLTQAVVTFHTNRAALEKQPRFQQRSKNIRRLIISQINSGLA